MRYFDRRTDRPICLPHLSAQAGLPFVEAVEVGVEDDAYGVGGDSAAHHGDEQAVVRCHPGEFGVQAFDEAGVGGLILRLMFPGLDALS